MLGMAQMGPTARDGTREDVVKRMLELLYEAADRNVELLVFPELALTTFFPRWYIEDEEEMLSYFEREMPSEATQPLFDEAARLGIGFCLGYAEVLTDDEGVTIATTPRYWWNGTAPRWPNSARSTYPDTPRGKSGDPSNTPRDTSSSPARTASECGGPSGGLWAWPYAMIGGGRRPTG